jgi:hypothetical protein
MRKLKDDFRPGQWIAGISADWLNTVARRLNNIFMENGEVIIDDRSIYIQPDIYSGTRIPNFPKSFDLVLKSWTSGDKPTMTVKEGYFNRQGQDPYLFAETDLELEKSQTLIYIFLEYPEGGTAAIKQQEGAPRPQTVPGTWRKVLYEVSTAASGEPTVDWDRRQDFDIGSPI